MFSFYNASILLYHVSHVITASISRSSRLCPLLPRQNVVSIKSDRCSRVSQRTDGEHHGKPGESRWRYNRIGCHYAARTRGSPVPSQAHYRYPAHLPVSINTYELPDAKGVDQVPAWHLAV